MLAVGCVLTLNSAKTPRLLLHRAGSWRKRSSAAPWGIITKWWYERLHHCCTRVYEESPSDNFDRDGFRKWATHFSRLNGFAVRHPNSLPQHARATCKSVSVIDYSTGTEYVYTSESGTSDSVSAVGGSIDGNIGATASVTTAASYPTITSSGSDAPLPWDGTHRPSDSFSTPDIWPWVATATHGPTSTDPVEVNSSGGRSLAPFTASTSESPSFINFINIWFAVWLTFRPFGRPLPRLLHFDIRCLWFPPPSLALRLRAALSHINTSTGLHPTFGVVSHRLLHNQDLLHRLWSHRLLYDKHQRHNLPSPPFLLTWMVQSSFFLEFWFTLHMKIDYCIHTYIHTYIHLEQLVNSAFLGFAFGFWFLTCTYFMILIMLYDNEIRCIDERVLAKYILHNLPTWPN